MRIHLDRREMMKLMAMAAAYSQPVHFRPPENHAHSQNEKNILVVVFDAFSAQHLPFSGYPRQTMPYLSNMLDKATVYHNHYAAGNFTTPGTASLLTGTYPWQHRAINLGDRVDARMVDHNLFSAFAGHSRLAYTHNPYADVFLRQFFSHIEEYTYPESLYLTKHWLSGITKKDLQIAKLSTQRIFEESGQTGNSLLLKTLFRDQGFAAWIDKRQEQQLAPYQPRFPRGLPSAQNPDLSFDTFTLEQAIDWQIGELKVIPQPFLSYFHLLPPHESYNTRQDFVDVFLDDNRTPALKETHLLANPAVNHQENYSQRRQYYDEYILYVDAEFKRLVDALQQNGLLENTILIFTSDHGEMFERGFIKHNGPSMHQPLIQVPLVIFDPQSSERKDVSQPTSAIDLIPTLLYLNGMEPDASFPGQLLPPYRSEPRNEPVYAFQAAGSQPGQAYDVFTGMIVENGHKLNYYRGYEGLHGQPYIEYYDLENDPHELDNLYLPGDPAAQTLIDKLLGQINNTGEGSA